MIFNVAVKVFIKEGSESLWQSTVMLCSCFDCALSVDCIAAGDKTFIWCCFFSDEVNKVSSICDRFIIVMTYAIMLLISFIFKFSYIMRYFNYIIFAVKGKKKIIEKIIL